MVRLFKFKRLYSIRAVHHKPPTATIQFPDCVAHVDSCTKFRSHSKGKQLHAYAISSGLLLCTGGRRLRSKLATMYAACGAVDDARWLFDEIPKLAVSAFLWNALIRGYAQNGRSADALRTFDEMLCSGRQRPDNFSFPFALKSCGDRGLLKLGVEIHCQAVVGGFGGDAYVQNSLISLYMSCGEVQRAKLVFDSMPERTVVSWNTMIAGSFKNGYSGEALRLFKQMMDMGVEPDCATIVSVLPVCAHLKDLSCGRRVNNLVDRMGFQSHLAVRNSLIDMYAKCGSLDLALRVFDEAHEKDVVSWTAMIGGCVLNGFRLKHWLFPMI